MGYPTINSSTPVTTTSNQTDSLPSPISDDDLYGDMYGELGTFDVEPSKAEIAPQKANDSGYDSDDDLPDPVPLDQMTVLVARPKQKPDFPTTVLEFADDLAALEALQDEIALDKKSLKNGNWRKIPAVLQYTRALIDLENKTHPELPIVYIADSEDLARHISVYARTGVPSAQFIVRHDLTSHVTFVDYRLIDGKPSILSFESIDFEDVSLAVSQNYLFTTALTVNPNMQFAGISLEVQFDGASCSIFALNLAKQAARHPEIMDKLHADNVAGKISHPACQVVHPKNPKTTWTSNAVLPKEFIKHSQSRSNTEIYMGKNPEENTKPINTKGQNLRSYQRAHFEMHEGQGKPASIVHKRVKYLEQLYEAAIKQTN